jgi:hypothetical protein
MTPSRGRNSPPHLCQLVPAPERMLGVLCRAALPLDAPIIGRLGGKVIEKACADSCRRRRCLFAADGSGRGREARVSQKPALRSDRSEDCPPCGSTVKTADHGMLVEFASEVDAVPAAEG